LRALFARVCVSQAAAYRGAIPDRPHRSVLDDRHALIAGKPILVGGETAAIHGEMRFARHFKIDGDRSVHFGAFDCSSPKAAADAGERRRIGAV
jgi:hypothetical protein